MNKRTRLLAILAAVACFFVFMSCGKLFGTKIPEEKFVSYYVDYIVAQDSLGRDTASTAKILETLNKKYDVTQKQYDNTIKYYSENPDDWDKFFEKVIDLAQKKRAGH